MSLGDMVTTFFVAFCCISILWASAEMAVALKVRPLVVRDPWTGAPRAYRQMLKEQEEQGL